MLLGRNDELKLLDSLIKSNRAELGIVYGRRRVGKSTLLKHPLRKDLDLYFEAIRGLSRKEQINHFLDQFSKQTKTPPLRASTWKEALSAVTPFLSSGKHYVVFDELPWMAGGRTELIAHLKYFWDLSWKENKGLTLILCGSIANFMINHVVHSEALHNRKTFELRLDPLPAKESTLFFPKSRSKIEIAKYLMTFGGVPKYLEQIDPRHSYEHNINRLCFSKGGFFLEELETIFKEQFKSTRTYEKIVSALIKTPLSQEEIARKLGMKAGGGLTEALTHLERAQIISRNPSIGLQGEKKTKTLRFSLYDEWIRFYYFFMSKKIDLIKQNSRAGFFEGISQRNLPVFFGIAFEKLVIKNLFSVCDALEIPIHQIEAFGPYFVQNSRGKNIDSPNDGLQIDLMLQRKNRIWSLIEIKFTEKPVGSGVIDEVERKLKILRQPKNISLEKILISATGATDSVIEAEYFDRILTLDDLF